MLFVKLGLTYLMTEDILKKNMEVGSGSLAQSSQDYAIVTDNNDGSLLESHSWPVNTVNLLPLSTRNTRV